MVDKILKDQIFYLKVERKWSSDEDRCIIDLKIKLIKQKLKIFKLLSKKYKPLELFFLSRNDFSYEKLNETYHMDNLVDRINLSRYKNKLKKLKFIYDNQQLSSGNRS